VKECARLEGLVDDSAPELQSEFVAFVTADCPGNALALVAQCRGAVTTELDRATVLVSPVGLVTNSPLLRNRNLPIVTPAWLIESAAAGVVLPKERFAPTTLVSPPVLAPRERRSNGHNTGIGLFSGSSFVVLGFEETAAQQLCGLVMMGGGRLGSGEPDCYYILNDGFAAPPSCERKLSASWLRVAVQQGRAPDMSHFASAPFAFESPSVLMAGVEVSTTGFAEPERSLLQDCIVRLGARYGSQLHKRRTTHLVCKVREREIEREREREREK
jgi:hypothetical protein